MDVWMCLYISLSMWPAATRIKSVPNMFFAHFLFCTLVSRTMRPVDLDNYGILMAHACSFVSHAVFKAPVLHHFVHGFSSSHTHTHTHIHIHIHIHPLTYALNLFYTAVNLALEPVSHLLVRSKAFAQVLPPVCIYSFYSIFVSALQYRKSYVRYLQGGCIICSDIPHPQPVHVGP